jgi:hypothetical protein
VDFSLTKKEGVISLSIGEPDFETPFEIEQAGIASIQNGYTFYSDGAGLPQLRKAISKYLDRHYGLSYNPSDEILVTVGASEAIDIALRAFSMKAMKFCFRFLLIFPTLRSSNSRVAKSWRSLSMKIKRSVFNPKTSKTLSRPSPNC